MAYFADGQHGGIYGHYPLWVTQFLADQLKAHPDWKINLEIEPETWDVVQTTTPMAYEAFKAAFADQSDQGRIKYTNPEYGQSYLWNIPGECMIRQFDYGIRKLRSHFPNAEFAAYASEEPMFTSALPSVLKSFGFKYAVVKNPNTCWGGYTRAHGGELVNWIGPDGTAIITSPRYSIERLLEPQTTWATIANADSNEYVDAAFKAGIEQPIGMTYQDAGWSFGPWLGDKSKLSHPVTYVTWEHYFAHVATQKPTDNWHFSQEDVLVSLVWGSQILQQVAQECRSAENKLLTGETMAAMAKFYTNAPWPQAPLDEAWRTLLLSQHHDCWIVPYNKHGSLTWAGHVKEWTGNSSQTGDDVFKQSVDALTSDAAGLDDVYARVYNSLGVARNEVVSVALPQDWDPSQTRVVDDKQQEIPSQVASSSETSARELVFQAAAPAMGYNTYQLEKTPPTPVKGVSASAQADGTYAIETDLYKITLDPAKGGVFKSLVAKTLDRKEFVSSAKARKFGEIRGYFYNDGGFHSSADNPARITIVENGPVRVRVAVNGTIDSNPFTQVITVAQGQKAIDLHLHIDWNGNPGIGSDYGQNPGGSTKQDPKNRAKNQKAFYDDQYKLLADFPLNFKSEKIYKNAPFDVTESKLADTVFTTWDGIKNNIILNWVDVLDSSSDEGMALLTDHTTSYVHGADLPLGLTLQYSGTGLWGRNYTITGPLDVGYALVPHGHRWDRAGLWQESDNWNRPLGVTVTNSELSPGDYRKSLIDATGTGLELAGTYFQGNDLIVRVFNAEGDASPKTLRYNGHADKIQLVELDGSVKADLATPRNEKDQTLLSLTLPRFGIRTIKFSNAHN